MLRCSELDRVFKIRNCRFNRVVNDRFIQRDELEREANQLDCFPRLYAVRWFSGDVKDVVETDGRDLADDCAFFHKFPNLRGGGSVGMLPLEVIQKNIGIDQNEPSGSVFARAMIIEPPASPVHRSSLAGCPWIGGSVAEVFSGGL